jgi:alpha-mannosidase
MSLLRTVAIVIVALWLGAPGVHTQQPPPGPRPTLYLVSNSHLDTQWNWTVQDTIRQLVPATFYDNFALFDRFPDYTFNFEGAIHYMWFKEYHADAWPRLRKYVADGRWRLSGSWVNAADTNLPSPEALMRQALYGKRFYRQEFGRVSRDIYLPDCFGFGFALPSIGVHSGLEAFSMQKLSWGAEKPTPFAVGLWKGVDGSSLVASLRGGDYVAQVTSDISVDPKWNADLVTLADGHKVGFRYFGVGDQGGAPDAVSVEWVEKAIKNTGGAVEVRNTSADQLARDLTDAQRASLPVYEGELLLKTHGVGCYTSQAAMKAFNRRNEQLADAAGWREGRVPARAARLNQPLVAFQAQAHPGALGRSLGLIDVSDTHDQVAVRAFKKAEDSEELILRVQELYGRPVSGVQVSLPTGILNAREVNAAEEPVGEARVAGGKLTFNLTAYQPRTFAVTPDASAARVAAVASSPLDLPFNLDGISTEANRADGDFDGRGRTYPLRAGPWCGSNRPAVGYLPEANRVAACSAVRANPGADE